MANLAIIKWCQKPEKWLKPWHMGTHLWQGLDGFQKSLHPFASGKHSLSIGRVRINKSPILNVQNSGIHVSFNQALQEINPSVLIIDVPVTVSKTDNEHSQTYSITRYQGELAAINEFNYDQNIGKAIQFSSGYHMKCHDYIWDFPHFGQRVNFSAWYQIKLKLTQPTMRGSGLGIKQRCVRYV